MFQKDSYFRDSERLLGVANYALSVFRSLGEELGEATGERSPSSSLRRVTSAVRWIEERLAAIPSHEGKPFRKGRGSAAELDALVRQAFRTLGRIHKALMHKQKARAYGAALEGKVELDDRLREIDENERRRDYGIAA